MERHLGAAEVRPLRHGLEVIDRFSRLDFDSPGQLPAAVGRRQHEIWKELDLPHSHRQGLRLADVGHDVPFPLQADLKKSDDAVVLELLAHGAHKNGAHWTSRGSETKRLDRFEEAIAAQL